MQEVSIDSLQQQARMFWGKVREVRIFLREGGTPPPTRTTSTSADLGVSLSLSPSSLFPSYSSASVSSSLLVASWNSCRSSCLIHWGVLLPRPPVSSLLTPPMPPSLLPLFPRPLTPLGGLGMLSVGFQGFSTRWDLPRQLINYMCHNGS